MAAGPNPLRQALVAQLGGILAIACLIFLLEDYAHVDIRPLGLILAMLQGGIAAMIALRQGTPGWWMLIHLVFFPLIVLTLRIDIAPGWFLAGFLFLLLLFWRTDRSRVPLYLTNRTTAQTLLKLLPQEPCRILDIGCGDGSLLRRLALARPDCQCVGIEHAPLPWLLAKLRVARLPNARVQRGDFWETALTDYAVIYAFLSPAPMPQLWAKAVAEARPGTLLVSNSFPIPDQPADPIVRVADRRHTRLYCYRPHREQQAGEFAAFPAIPQPANQE